MADTFDENGLVISTLTEITEALNAALQEVHGDDINLEYNSPDGQTVGIFAQASRDLRELLLQLYTSFDPDEASGTSLDARCAINGVKRSSGSFTMQYIDVVTSQSVSLVGLDDDAELDEITVNPFTIKDGSDNRLFLVSSTTISAAGTTSLLFRAEYRGVQEYTVNTITNIETVTKGVTSVNNSLSEDSIGTEFETDSALKIRRNKQISISSVGYLDSILAALLDIDGVVYADVQENVTSEEDEAGIPAHSVWIIVDGGSSEDIATVLYKKKSSGSGMKGDTSYAVERVNGSYFTAKWDYVEYEELYCRFSIEFSGVYDEDNVKLQIVENTSWEVYENANISDIIYAIKNINSNFKVSDAGMSKDGITYTDTVSPSSRKNRFKLTIERIEIV